MSFLITLLVGCSTILHCVHGSTLQQGDEVVSKFKTFNGAQVHRVVATTKEQWSALMKLYERDSLDFWTNPRLNSFTDVMIYPNQKSRFLAYLYKNGMQSTIIIEDVQRLVENERKLLSKLREKSRNVPMDFTIYHNISEIETWVTGLPSQYPGMVSIEIIGYSVEQRPIYALKISNVDASNENTPKILLDAGIHAREWITPAVALWTINELLTTRPEILKKMEIFIIPVLNPDGYEYTWSYHRLWRKNRVITKKPGCIGTDLNRNFDYVWGGEGSSKDACSQIYKGAAPFSEPEAKALRDFIWRENKFDQMLMYLTLHSYGQFWFTPWGWTDQDTPDKDEQMRMAELSVTALANVHGTKYTYGPSAALLYAAAGGSDDWTYGDGGIIYSHCVELRDIDHYGFQLPPDQIVPTSEEFYAGMMAACKDLVKAF